MAIGEGRNIDQAVNQQLCFLASLSLYNNRQVQHATAFCITAEDALISLTISHFILPPLVNKTLRYLNSFTWGHGSSPTWSRQSTLFRLRMKASDLEVLILIPTTSHSVANHPKWTELAAQQALNPVTQGPIRSSTSYSQNTPPTEHADGLSCMPFPSQ